jgi:hypothetical protein
MHNSNQTFVVLQSKSQLKKTKLYFILPILLAIFASIVWMWSITSPTSKEDILLSSNTQQVSKAESIQIADLAHNQRQILDTSNHKFVLTNSAQVYGCKLPCNAGSSLLMENVLKMWTINLETEEFFYVLNSEGFLFYEKLESITNESTWRLESLLRVDFESIDSIDVVNQISTPRNEFFVTRDGLFYFCSITCGDGILFQIDVDGPVDEAVLGDELVDTISIRQNDLWKVLTFSPVEVAFYMRQKS